MGYKYLNVNPKVTENPGDIWIQGFQANIDAQFYNAPDAYIIQEELTIGQLNFQNVEVRINRGINSYTGDKLGDDYKQLIFKDLAHSTSIGYKYKFDDNDWLVINSEIIKNFAASCIVKRCNNVLRWIDEYGNYYEEPCIINYNIEEPRDRIGVSNPIIPSGRIDVYCQVNSRTKKIKGSQRFLFGVPENRVAFKVYGDGVRNFLNQKTEDDNSSAILVLSMGGNFINPDTDDIENGVADSLQILYSMSLSENIISGSPTDTFKLIPIVTYNGNPAVVPLTFSTSSSQIASVDLNGIVTFNSNGSAILTASMLKNSSISASCVANISASPINYYEIRISPEPAYILQGSSQNYNIYLYENGSQISGSFIFSTENSLVPNSNYSLTSTASSLEITNNKKYVNSPLVIDITSGSTTRQVEIYLKGSW